MRGNAPLIAGLAVLALAGVPSSPALARSAPNGPEASAAPISQAVRQPQRASNEYAALPIEGMVKRDGAYYLDIDVRALEREGFDTYATVGGSQAGFARLSAGLVTTAPLSGALFDGWTLIGMTGYGRRTDTSVLRNLESGNQWVGGLGFGYRF
ncbi:hypothetical protein [Sphingobium fluviale]|uniref:MipA/OmpV family protein n=1 Tax=Sphingobium fluviale TaxID=2506423 RepID=A0A4Q1KFI9_9SPHN|nr:hypothetical protein [Sphingobium fluviale]RXR27567.1 hypothetical protein EQG66_11860 [Sphingobium fluviale]